MSIRRMAVALATAALAVAGCGGTESVSSNIEEAPATSEMVGEPAVFERIEALTDCAAIQEEFDLAFNSSEAADPGSAQHEAAVAYMDAADERLADVGCYE